MLRIILILAAGVTLGAFISAIVNGNESHADLGFFALAITVVTFVLNVIISVFGGHFSSGRLIAQARAQGQIKAARIDSLRQTGTQVNDQPELEATVIVAAYPEAPFRTTARGVIQHIDLARFQPGALVSVAHPDPETDRVFLVGDPVSDQAEDAYLRSVSRLGERSLPAPQRRISPLVVPFGSQPRLRSWTYLVLFALAATATPYVLERFPAAAAVTGQGSPADTDVFSETGLEEALSTVAAEAGTTEVFSVVLYDTYLVAAVPSEPGADTSDEVVFRQGGIDRRRPEPIQPKDPAAELFETGDVDWDAVLQLAADVPAIAADEDLADAEVGHVVVQASPVTSELEVRVFGSAPYGSITIVATPAGEIVSVSAS